MPEFNIKVNSYNPKSKSELDALSQMYSSSAKQNLLENVEISPELIDNPSQYDTVYNRDELGDYNAIQKNRAEQQPWYDQLGNAVNQAVLGEIVGGTIMSAGALFDPLIRTTEDSEQDFHNFIYDIGNNISEWTREATPIYRDPDKRFSDSGWWLQNGTSVVSSLSMLIPGMAVSKGIKFLGGLMKLSKLGTAGVVGLDLAETFGGALAMRHAENFREASGVFDTTIKAGEAKVDSDINMELQKIQSMLQPTMEAELNNLPPITVGPESPYYQEQVVNRKLQEENIKNKYNSIYEAEAQKIHNTRASRLENISKVASDAASMDYTANYANLIFDVIQLGAILKPLKGFTRNANVGSKLAAADEVVSGVTRGATSKVGKTLKKLGEYELLESGTEGIEEGINTISQFESERKGRIDLGIEEDDGSSFGDRLVNEHLGKAELWDAAMWGVAGGVAFQQIGKAINGDVSTKNKILEVAERKENLTKYLDAINKAEANGDDLKVRNLSKQLEYDIARRASQAGNVDLLLDHINSPKFLQEMKDSGLSDEKAALKIKDLKETVEFVENQYKSMYDEIRTEPRAFNYMIGQKINERDAVKLKEETNLKINELQGKIAQNNLINGVNGNIQTLHNSLFELEATNEALNNVAKKLNELATEGQFTKVDKDFFFRADGKTQKDKKREIEYNSNAYELREQYKELHKKKQILEKSQKELIKNYSELNNVTEEEALKEIQDKVNNFSSLELELITQKAILKGQIEREQNSIKNQNKFKNDKSFREEQLKAYDDEIVEAKKERETKKDNEFKETINDLSKEELNNIDSSKLTPQQSKVVEEKKTEIKVTEHVENKTAKNSADERFRITEDEFNEDIPFVLWDANEPVKGFATKKEALDHIDSIIASESRQKEETNINQVNDTIEVDNEVIISDNIKDAIDESSYTSSNTLNGELLSAGKKAGNNVTLAYLSLEYTKDSEGNFEDAYDNEGDLIKANEDNRSMLTPGKFKAGKSVEIFIDKSKSNSSNNSDNIPIAIQLTEDSGKPITTWLHEVAWYYEADGKTLANGVKQEAVDEVKRLRKLLFDNQDEVFETTLKGSTPGTINKVKVDKSLSQDKQWESLRGMKATFGNSDASIGFIDRNGTFKSGDKRVLNKPSFNRRVGGMAFMFIPTAIDGYLATYINQRTINELKSKDRTINILSGLIWNWAYNKESLNNLDIKSFDDIKNEIQKHINITQCKTSGLNIDTRTFFKFYDNMDETGPVLEVIEEGKVRRLQLNKMKVGVSELKEFISETLSYGKFPNIDKTSSDNFSNSVFSFVDVDEKGNLKESKSQVSSYLEFLDEFEYAKTNIQMIEDNEGNKTFVSQPVIAINTIDIGVKPDTKKNEGVSKGVNEGVKNISIEDKKADIERRRQEELNKQLQAGKSIFGITDEQIKGISKIDFTQIKEIQGQNIAGLQANAVGLIKEIIKKINTKYDAELAALEKETIATKEDKVANIPPTKESTNNKFSDDFFEDDMHFLIKPETYNTSKLENFKSTLGTHQQTQIVRQLTATILTAMDRQKNAKTKEDRLFQDLTPDSPISINRMMEYLKDFLNEVKVRNSDNPTIIANVDLVLKTFDTSDEFIGFRELIEHNIEQLKFNIGLEEDESVEIIEGSNDKTSHADNRNDRTDPERSMSGRIKRLLANINEVHYKSEKQDDGSMKLVPYTEKSAIGVPVRRDPASVFNFLTSLLADTPIKEMNEVLTDLSQDQTESGLISRQVLKILSTLPKNELNEFYSVMRLTNKTFKSLLYSQDKNGIPTISLINTNQNSAADILLSNWRSNLWVTAPKLMQDVLEDGTIIWNKKEADLIGDKFNAWSKSKDKDIKQLSKLFESIGMIVSPQALVVYARMLKKEYRKTNRDKTKEIDNLSLGDIIIRRAGIKKITDALGKKDIFLDETATIKNFAKYENIVHPTVQSNSYRDDAGNMIYGIVPGTFLDSQIRKLITDENYRLSLASTPFANSSRILNELIANNGNKDNQFGIFYLGALKNKAVRDSVTTYEEQNEFNKELTNLNLFANNNSNSALHITITPSDKTTFFLGQCSRLKMDGISFVNGNINFNNNGVALEQFTKYVLSEISRVNQTIEDYNKYKDTDKTKLINNYHYMIDKSTREEVLGSGSYMMLFPDIIKTLSKFKLSKDIKTDNGDAYKGQIILDENDTQVIKEYLKSFLTGMINDKINDWKDLGIYEFTKDEKIKHLAINSQYTNPIIKKFSNGQDAINYMATDYLLNRMDWYINQYMLIDADPSFFYDGKAKDSTWENIIDATAKNLFKRTAKTVAPGRQGNWVNDAARYLMINEPGVFSGIKLNEKLSQSIRDSYGKILDISDAQEWISPEEYIRQLFAFGNITEEQYNNLLTNIDNLSDEEIKVVMQPIKPVYVNNQIDSNLNINVPYYIKTSAFPLLRQLVSGTELEKLLDIMRKHKIDRVVPKSAVKLGYRNNLQMFDENGNVVIDETKIQSNIVELSREGYRIQQDVPYDEAHDHSTWGSQFVKLRFANLPMDMTVKMNNKDITVKQLKTLDDNIHREFYQRRWNKLLNELGFEKVGNSYSSKDLVKLQKMLIQEASSQGLVTNDLLMLKLINNNSIFDIPLMFQNNADKLEALMQSLIKNRVLKFKLPGKHYVQGSPVGFTFDKTKIQKGGDISNKGIIWTKGHDGKHLDYKFDDDGVYAEIVVAPYFLNKDKKLIDISEYVKDGYIDTDKIDPELLTMIGYRIPTQGHNSMIRLKVVGFLPKSSGDLILVPAAITKQMGSDFDVDKLYVHNFNYYFDADNNIKKLSTKNADTNKLSELTDTELENLLLDISHSILRSNNEQVVNQIMQPLDSGPLNDVIKELDALTPPEDKGNFSAQASSMSGLINPKFQSFMVETNAAGKIGVGTWSVISVNHILSQQAGIYIKIPRDPKTNEPLYDKAVSVKFLDSKGKLFNDTVNDSNQIVSLNETNDEYQKEGAWKLNKINTFESGKSITEVISYIQSASVDNAKDQQLIRLNLNKYTFNVAGLIAETGFDERYIGAFLRQPIIVDYVKMLNNLDKITDSEFNPNKSKEAASKFLKEYLNLTGNLKFEDITPIVAVSLKEMHDGIENHTKLKDDAEYKMFQARILVNFLKYNDIATELLSIRTANNTDTKLLDKSIASSIEKNTKLTNKLMNSINIGNVENLVDGTRQGGANEILNNSIELFTSVNLFPINNPALNKIRDSIKIQLKKDDLNEKDILSITSAYKASIFSKIASDIFSMDLNTMRDSLLYGDALVDDNGDLTGDGSLAAMITRYRLKNQTNSFLNSLTIKLNGSNHPSFIEFSSAKDVKDETNIGNPLAWLELLEAQKGSIERIIGEKLVQYSLIFGNERNARDFGRFMPVDYLNKVNFGQRLRKFVGDIALQDNEELILNTTNRIVTQWFQHNPNKGTSIKSFDSFSNLRDISGKETKDDVYSFTLPNKYQDNAFIMSLATEKDGMPLFISKFNKSTYKTDLYYKTKNGDAIVYVKISTLGGTLMSEYNLNEDFPSSILDSTKNVSVNFSDKKNTVEQPMINELPVLPKKEEGDISITEKYNFNENAKGILTRLSQIGSTPEIQAIAKYYLDNQLGYLSDIVFTTSETKPDVSEALKININPSTDSEFNDIRLAMGYDIRIASVLETIILHEITHSVLKAKLNPKNIGSLSLKEQEVVGALKKVYESAKDNEELKIRIIEANKGMYWRGLDDIDEFTSLIMSDEGFRSILNNITYPKSKKTYLEKILQLFKNLLTINVKPGNYLADALGAIIELTNKSEVINSGDTINIYWSDKTSPEEHRMLSNLAPREFNKDGKKYYSVEHAYQTLKSGKFDEKIYNKYKSGGVKITGNLGTKTENNWNIKLMKNIMKLSFEQDLNAKNLLLNTNDANFTHNQDNTIWRSEFPKLLMEVRDELRIAQKTIITSVASIPQNLVSGVESFGTKQEATSKVKKILGNSPHSIDMIEIGLRTRTTRSVGEMQKYNIKVGDIVKQFGKSADGSTKQVLTRIVAIHYKGSPEFLNTWYKEGWTQDGIKEIGRYKDGAAAIEFEIIDNSGKNPTRIKQTSQPSEIDEFLKEKENNEDTTGWESKANFLIDPNGKKTTVQGFMKNLTPEGRAKLRKLISSKDVIFKC